MKKLLAKKSFICVKPDQTQINKSMVKSKTDIRKTSNIQQLLEINSPLELS